MTEDPVIEEVRRLREEYAAQFDYDLAAIWKDLQRQTEAAAAAGQTVVTLPPRRPEARPTPTKRAG